MNGQVKAEGEPSQIIDVYRSSVDLNKEKKRENNGSGEIKISKVELFDAVNSIKGEFGVNESVMIRIHYSAYKMVRNPIFGVTFYSPEDFIVSHIRTDADNITIGEISGEGFIDLNIENLNLLPNLYKISVWILQEDGLAVYDAHYKEHKY